MAKKPRQNKMDPRKIPIGGEKTPKKEKDWTFEDIVRSKSRHR